MLRQIRFELFKMSRRPRTYIGCAAFLAMNFLLVLGIRYGGIGGMIAHQASAQGFEMIGSPANAEFMAWMVVGSPMSGPILMMFMPFFVCLIFGEIFGGESAEGTLRTVLTRPIGRSSFFTAKFAASLIYALGLVLFLGVSAYVMGLIAFGRGGLVAAGTFRRPMLTYYPEWTGMVRLALAYGVTFVGVVTVGMVALFVSSWLNSALGAIGGAIGLLFAMVIIGEIPYFAPIRDYLFSTHLFAGQNAFLDPIPWNEIRLALTCLGTYIGVLFLVSMLIFRRKDVLA